MKLQSPNKTARVDPNASNDPETTGSSLLRDEDLLLKDVGIALAKDGHKAQTTEFLK